MQTYVKPEILSDGSKVFNLEVYESEEEMREKTLVVTFSCISEEHAYDLIEALKKNTIDFE